MRKVRRETLNLFIGNSILIMPVEEFLKSTDICQRYRQKSKGAFFSGHDVVGRLRTFSVLKNVDVSQTHQQTSVTADFPARHRTYDAITAAEAMAVLFSAYHQIFVNTITHKTLHLV